MNVVGAILGCTVVFAATYLLAGLFASRAGHLGLLQSANHRSSHHVPTPTGGGIILALVMAPVALLLFSGDWLLFAGLSSSVVLVAVGLVDDIREVPPPLRLFAQSVCVAILIATLVPEVGSLEGLFGLAIGLAAIVGAVWWLNLFNFMDGIDGLAAGQALFMIVAGLLIAHLGEPAVAGTAFWWWMAAFAASVAGFAAVNWSPARLFMGDTGTALLGFALLAMALVTTRLEWISALQWLILACLFVTDATVTLMRRLFRGENVFAGHRRHAYQILARRLGRHDRAASLYMAANAFVVLPAAIAIGIWPDAALPVTVAVYLAAALCCLAAGAGRRSE